MTPQAINLTGNRGCKAIVFNQQFVVPWNKGMKCITLCTTLSIKLPLRARQSSGLCGMSSHLMRLPGPIQSSSCGVTTCWLLPSLMIPLCKILEFKLEFTKWICICLPMLNGISIPQVVWWPRVDNKISIFQMIPLACLWKQALFCPFWMLKKTEWACWKL